MILDWFVYYTSSVANALSDDAEMLIVERDNGFEIGVSKSRDAKIARRNMLDSKIEICFIGGRQRNIFTAISAIKCGLKIRNFRPDIIHLQDLSDWRLYLAALFARCPLVVTLHDVVPHVGVLSYRRGIQRLVTKWVQSRAAAFIVHGSRLAKNLSKMAWYKNDQLIAIIPHGELAHTGLRDVEPSPLPQSCVALFFGRLEAYKGLDVLIEGAKIAQKYLPDLKVVIAGQGKCAIELIKLIGTNPLFELNIRFIKDEEIPQLFARSSFVVLPYTEASQSGVVPLAFMNGRTAIVSEVGDLCDVVQDGKNGICVKPSDAPGLAEAIVRLGNDRDFLECLSIEAHREIVCGRLSPKAICHRHLEVYDEVLRRKGRL